MPSNLAVSYNGKDSLTVFSMKAQIGHIRIKLGRKRFLHVLLLLVQVLAWRFTKLRLKTFGEI